MSSDGIENGVVPNGVDDVELTDCIRNVAVQLLKDLNGPSLVVKAAIEELLSVLDGEGSFQIKRSNLCHDGSKYFLTARSEGLVSQYKFLEMEDDSFTYEFKAQLACGTAINVCFNSKYFPPVVTDSTYISSRVYAEDGNNQSDMNWLFSAY